MPSDSHQPQMDQILGAFFGKRVLVTGHTGFKGSWLTFLLKELGADVLGFALAPDARSHFELLKLDKGITHLVGDVRDRDAVVSATREFKPEFVFHLAAQALVKESYADPVTTFSTNVMGSVHILEAVRACDSVRSLVYITSDKCYENVEWVWGYREVDRLGGHDPYSASKAAAELVFSAYARSYLAGRTTLGAASARAGNVIGGGDWAKDRIVPDCVRAIEAGRVIELRSPTATRPWQHVLEPISGYLLLAARLHQEPARYAGAWNFGPPSSVPRTVLDVAKVISDRLGGQPPRVVGNQTTHHEANLLQLNCDKASHLLSWYPRWGVDKTLDATADWYSAVMKGESPDSVTRAQLRDYFPELR
jgi:CDP-glucose 4,6-dehydratase